MKVSLDYLKNSVKREYDEKCVKDEEGAAAEDSLV